MTRAVFFFSACLVLCGSQDARSDERIAASFTGVWQDSVMSRGSIVRPLDEANWQLAARLFRITLRRSAERKPFDNLSERWAALGYRLEQAESLRPDAEQIWVLREQNSGAVDEGLFAFRLGRPDKAPALLLQAPHLDDKLTGEILCKMFLEGSAVAAAWGTSPREARCGDSCSDLTHRKNSLFHALTIAFARVHPDSRIAQLHGFSPGRRKSVSGRQAGVIVACGQDQPSRLSSAVSVELAHDWDTNVRLFGASVHELGALTNAQILELSSLHYRGFLHLEFNPFNRQCLLASSALRAQLERSILYEPNSPRIDTVAKE